MKKLVISSLLFGSLFLGGIYEASEIEDVSILDKELSSVLETKNKLISEKEELEVLIEKDKVIEDTLAHKKLPLDVKQKESSLLDNVSFKLKTESNDEKLEKLLIEIKKNSKVEESLETKKNNILEFEKILTTSLENNSYDVKSSTKKELENKLVEIKNKKETIDNYKIDLVDDSFKNKVSSELDNIINTLTKDIKEYQSQADRVVANALQYLGVPYVWGGKEPHGMDCSGLTQLAYRSVGKEIGIWTVAQESSGKVIPVSQAEKGDLLFWGPHGATDHVAIYLGDGSFVHAPQPHDFVRITKLNEFMPDFAMKVTI